MPSNIRTRPLPSDLQDLRNAFTEHIVNAQQDLEDFEQRRSKSVQDKVVIYCLGQAIDLSRGCLMSVDAELPSSSVTLSRAILETMFSARYVTLSEENAQELADSMLNELKRIARKNLNAGYATVVDIGSGEDRSDEFLSSSVMREIPRRTRIESVAEGGGLGGVYTKAYGFAAMIAHGKALGLETALNSEESFFATLSMALGALQCVELIAMDWVRFRTSTRLETLQRLLGA